MSAACERRGSRRATLAATVLVVLVLVPFGWALLTAVKPYTAAFTSPPTWSFAPTWQSFVDLWQATQFAFVFLDTMVVAVASVVVSLVVGAPAAYALARYPGRVAVWLLVLALVFRAMPRFAVVLPFYDAARAVGLYDTRTVLVVALVAINQPFTLWMLRNFFASVPRELEEAAMTDGCSRFGAFRRVVLPAVAPGLVTAGVFTLLLAYQEYLVALALTQTEAVTIPVFVASLSTTENADLYQVIAACSVVLAVPVVVIALFAQRYLVAGLTGGAVKG